MENTMKLEDTVKTMTHASYRERFKAEYYQTKIRYEKLKSFNNKIEAAKLVDAEEPEHDCPLELLKQQQRVMGEYLRVLELRAVIEKIEL